MDMIKIKTDIDILSIYKTRLNNRLREWLTCVSVLLTEWAETESPPGSFSLTV